MNIMIIIANNLNLQLEHNFIIQYKFTQTRTLRNLGIKKIWLLENKPLFMEWLWPVFSLKDMNIYDISYMYNLYCMQLFSNYCFYVFYILTKTRQKKSCWCSKQGVGLIFRRIGVWASYVHHSWRAKFLCVCNPLYLVNIRAQEQLQRNLPHLNRRVHPNDVELHLCFTCLFLVFILPT